MSTGNIKAENKSQMSKTFPTGWGARGRSQDLNLMEKEFREQAQKLEEKMNRG